jgi:adenosylhomocysteine nucleosidase
MRRPRSRRLAPPPFIRTAAVAIVAVLLTCSCRVWAPAPSNPTGSRGSVVVLVSANAEWKVVRSLHPGVVVQRSPWGEYFETDVGAGPSARRVLFAHGGWGKVAAAGSTQYVIDRWKPSLLVNLGTCGGFEGDVNRYDTILVDRTIIYDIKEAMGDSSEAISDYSTTVDLAWLGTRYPSAVRKTLLVSADRDLVPAEMADLKARYGAVAGDWETGAIAYVCARNGQRALILRGVSDLVSPAGGDAYDNMPAFEAGTRKVMTSLVDQLPGWLALSR